MKQTSAHVGVLQMAPQLTESSIATVLCAAERQILAAVQSQHLKISSSQLYLLELSEKVRQQNGSD